MSSADEEIIITILVIVLILILAFSFYSLYTCTGGTFKQDDWDKDKCFIIPKKSTSPAPAPAPAPTSPPSDSNNSLPVTKSAYEQALEYFNNFKPTDNLQFLTGLADEQWSEIQKKAEDDKVKCTVKDASVLFNQGEYTESELKETSDAIKNLCETQLTGDYNYCDNFTLNDVNSDDIQNNIPNSGKFKTDYKSEKICYTHEPGKCFPRVYNPEGPDGVYSYDSEDAKLLANIGGKSQYIDTNEICKTLLKKSECENKEEPLIYGEDKRLCRWVTGLGAHVDPLEVYKNASNTCDQGDAYKQQVGTCEMNTGLDTDMNMVDVEGNGAYSDNESIGTSVVCPGQKLNPDYTSENGEPLFIYDYVTRERCDLESNKTQGSTTNAKCFFKPKPGTYELRQGKRLERKGEYNLGTARCEDSNNSQPCRQQQEDFILCGKCENVTMVGADGWAKTGQTIIKNDINYTKWTVGNDEDKVTFGISNIEYDKLPTSIKDIIQKDTVDMTKITISANGNLNNYNDTVTSSEYTGKYKEYPDWNEEKTVKISNDDIKNRINNEKNNNYHIFITDDTIDKNKWKMRVINSKNNQQYYENNEEFYINKSFGDVLNKEWYKYYYISVNGPYMSGSPGGGSYVGHDIRLRFSPDRYHNKIEFYKNGIKVTEIDLKDIGQENNIDCNKYHDNRIGCNSETTFHGYFQGGHESRCQWKPHVHCYGEWNTPDTVIDADGKEVPNTCGAVVRGLKEERYNELSAQKATLKNGVWVNEILPIQGSKCKKEDIGWLDFTDLGASPSGSIATGANKESRKLPQNYTYPVSYGYWKNARPQHGDTRYTQCSVDCEEITYYKSCEDWSKPNPTEEDRKIFYDFGNSDNDDDNTDNDIDNYDFDKAYYAAQKECKGHETSYNIIKTYAQGTTGEKCPSFTLEESHGNYADPEKDNVKSIKGGECTVPKNMCAAGSSCIVNTTKIDDLVERINKKPNVRSEVVIVDNNNNQTLPDDNSMSITIDGVTYNHENKITKEILFRASKKVCDNFGDMSPYWYSVSGDTEETRNLKKSFCTEDKDIRYFPDNPSLNPCDFKSSDCDDGEKMGFGVQERQKYNASNSGTRKEQYKMVPMRIRPYEICKWINMPDPPSE